MSLHSWKVTYLLLQWWNSTPGSISHIGSQGCLTAIPNMPNNHNHTGKEGLDAMLPSCYWQLSMIETSEQKLHQRQQVAILSLNASLGSLCATTPHTQSKNEAKELCRQLAGHGSISRSFAQESAAFNHSLTAAAGSTGSGAMPLSLWAENLSLLYLRNLDPSMQYTHRNSTFRFQKCGVSALNVFIVPFIAAPKLTPWALASQGRITSGNALFNTGLACTSRDRNHEAFDPSILKTEAKQIV